MSPDLSIYYEKASYSFFNREYCALTKDEKQIIKTSVFPLIYSSSTQSFAEYFKSKKD